MRERGQDRFGWNPKATFASDIADAVNAEEADRGVRRRCIRLDFAAKTDGDLAMLIKQLRSAEREPNVEAEILKRLGLPARGPRIDWTGQIVLCPIKAIQSKGRSIEPVSEETDETDDSSLIGRQLLGAHTAGVMDHVRKFAAGCGLAADLASDLYLAARLHDWGKCDERFQTWLAGKRFNGGEYLAKSEGNRSREDNAKLRKAAGYPDEARHEAASVMAACS